MSIKSFTIEVLRSITAGGWRFLKSCLIILLLICILIGLLFAYSFIELLGVRLCLLVACIAAAVLLAGLQYKHTFIRQYGRPPGKGELKFACPWVVASLVVVAAAFGIFTLIMHILPLPIRQYETISMYGSYALSIFLFPIISLTLYMPIISDRSIHKCIKLFFVQLKTQYLIQLIISVLIVLVNLGISLLFNNTYARVFLSIMLSTLLWSLSWEISLLSSIHKGDKPLQA